MAEQRLASRTALNLPLDDSLAHYPQAAVDRRAVRDALVAQGLLHIEPRRRKCAALATSAEVAAMPQLENHQPVALAESGAGRIPAASMAALATVGDAAAQEPNVVLPGNQPTEEVHSSTNKPTAGGQD